MIIEIDADEAHLGKIVCYWEEDAALMSIRALLENWLLRKFFEFSGENEIQIALDALSVRALMLFEERAPRAFNLAQVQLVAEIFMELTEETLAGFEDLSSLKEVRKKWHATARRIHNGRIGIRRGRQSGKKDAKQRKKRSASAATKRGTILSAMRQIGAEPIHRKAVAPILGISAKTLGGWLEEIRKEFGEEWDDLIGIALSTGR